MTNPFTQSVLAFALTYLMHSTIVAAVVLTLLRVTVVRSYDLRIRLLRAALVVPVLTSLFSFAALVPHFGWQLNPWQQSNTAVTAVAAAPATPAESDAGPEREYGPPVAKPTLTETVLAASLAAPAGSRQSWWLRSVVTLLFIIVTWRLLGVIRQYIRLLAIKGRSPELRSQRRQQILQRLLLRLRLRRQVTVRSCGARTGPLTAGILRPFVLVPRAFAQRLSNSEFEAMLAHELVHVRQGDALWRLIGRMLHSVFFFQPLNGVLLRRLEMEAEYLADQRAAALIGQPGALARCLTKLGDWLAERSQGPAVAGLPLSAGMASFRSILGRRIESILEGDCPRPDRWSILLNFLCILSIGGAVLLVAPRASAVLTPEHPDERPDQMNASVPALALLTALAVPMSADEESAPAQQPAPLTKTTADDLPEGAHGFNGVLVGRLASKDVEKGAFVINVDVVPRVWRNSRAEAPKQMVGRNIRVDGVTGRWLDVLLLVRIGETLETEARHDEGNKLTFPGELLRKVAPYQPSDYPTLPEEFRGFRGAVRATIIDKDPELFEMIIRVERVLENSDKSSAKNAQSIEGKPLVLAGFWQRKDAYHQLKQGDVIDVGLHHIGRQSDHVNVDQFVRKTTAASASSAERPRMNGKMEPVRGFKGVLVGRLVSKDVEKGTLTLTVDRVPRVWKNNHSDRPKQLIGKQIQAGGLTGQHLDTLLVTREGETLEIGAFGDDTAGHFRVVELFRKVAPVKEGDYPELPDAFRGFQGEVVATVTQKDPQLYSLTIRIEDIIKSWDKNRAADAEQAVGKAVTLSGFWRRKDDYHRLEVGDRIRVGIRHAVRQSDAVDIAEKLTVLP